MSVASGAEACACRACQLERSVRRVIFNEDRIQSAVIGQGVDPVLHLELLILIATVSLARDLQARKRGTFRQKKAPGLSGGFFEKYFAR